MEYISTLNEADIEVDDEGIIVVIKDIEYEICHEASSNRACNNKNNTRYGKGILNSSHDQFRTERYGLFGEMGFSKLTQKPIDLGVGYDNGDFFLNSQSIDVKTSKSKYGECLITYQHNSGRYADIHDIYVFSYVESEDIDNKVARIKFVGYQEKPFITNLKPVMTKIDTPKPWLNYVVEKSDLLKINELIEKF